MKPTFCALLVMLSACASPMERTLDECGAVAVNGTTQYHSTATRTVRSIDVVAGCDEAVAHNRSRATFGVTSNGAPNSTVSREGVYRGSTDEGDPRVIEERYRHTSQGLPGRLHERSMERYEYRDNHTEVCLFGECVDVGEVRIRTTSTSTPRRERAGWHQPTLSVRCGPSGCVAHTPPPRRR